MRSGDWFSLRGFTGSPRAHLSFMALWFQLKQVVLHASYYSCNCDLWFQFVRNFTDTWAQIWFFPNTLDPTFQEAPGQDLLRTPLELGANKHVLPSPQPTQTLAIQFQNSMILRGKDIWQRQLKKNFQVKNFFAHQIGLMRVGRLGKIKQLFPTLLFKEIKHDPAYCRSKNIILTLKLKINQLLQWVRINQKCRPSHPCHAHVIAL